jgi:hypothetical protein
MVVRHYLYSMPETNFFVLIAYKIVAIMLFLQCPPLIRVDATCYLGAVKVHLIGKLVRRYPPIANSRLPAAAENESKHRSTHLLTIEKSSSVQSKMGLP